MQGNNINNKKKQLPLLKTKTKHRRNEINRRRKMLAFA
jgi:hypothetical protein